jgi:DNA-binding PadR family transcriptional regulator
VDGTGGGYDRHVSLGTTNHLVYTLNVSLSELHLALLARGPCHGYEIKRSHDAWFPDARPLPYGQVYATLGRLVRDGLAEVVETRTEGGPERTVYALTPAGTERLQDWLAEPAPPAASGAEEVVRKAVAALHLSDAAGSRAVLSRQRAEHLRAMRRLLDEAAQSADAAARLARRYTVLHLDADLRWLDEAVQELAPDDTRTATPTATSKGA